VLSQEGFVVLLPHCKGLAYACCADLSRAHAELHMNTRLIGVKALHASVRSSGNRPNCH